jgi:AraC family transcriptional regulator
MSDSKLTTPADSPTIAPAQRFALAPPRFVNREPMLLTGLREAMCENFADEITRLWQDFIGIMDKISHKVDGNCYGLCMKETQDGPELYYMACCEVSDFVDLPSALSPVILPSHCYAVFIHSGPVAHIKQTIFAIFDDWLPHSDYELAQQSAHCLHHLEKYSEQFDPVTGLGGMEIWVPVVPRNS